MSHSVSAMSSWLVGSNPSTYSGARTPGIVRRADPKVNGLGDLWSTVGDVFNAGSQIYTTVQKAINPTTPATANPTGTTVGNTVIPAPPAGWNDAAYLAANPDVAAAVAKGGFHDTSYPSGWQHYCQFGRNENRRTGQTAAPTTALAPSNYAGGGAGGSPGTSSATSYLPWLAIGGLALLALRK